MENEKKDPLATNQVRKYEFYKKTLTVRDNMIRSFITLPKSSKYIYAVQIMRGIEKVIENLLILDTLDIYDMEEAKERMVHHRKALVFYELIFTDITNAHEVGMFPEKAWESQLNLITEAVKMYHGMYKRDEAKFKELYGGTNK